MCLLDWGIKIQISLCPEKTLFSMQELRKYIYKSENISCGKTYPIKEVTVRGRGVACLGVKKNNCSVGMISTFHHPLGIIYSQNFLLNSPKDLVQIHGSGHGLWL
jgi:hypothetical protein